MDIPDWRRAHGAPVATGIIRRDESDFQVDEVLGFDPDGQGEHDLLLIRKTGANTAWVARRLAEAAGVASRDVGYCGMKDRHAVTTQWYSVRRPAPPHVDWPRLDIEGVEFMELARNSRKLRIGAHRGNHFRITVRDVEGDDGRLDERLRRIESRGIPNYFGEQRFGHQGRNIELALSLFAGKRLKREKRSIAISAARSLLFNSALDAQVESQSWDALDAGGFAALDGSNSVFEVPVIDEEVLGRIESMDIHPAGRMHGKTGPPLTRPEQLAYERYPELTAGLEAVASAGWRARRCAVRELTWSRDGNGVTLSFYLARGAFATAVLRECFACTVAAVPGQSRSSST